MVAVTVLIWFGLWLSGLSNFAAGELVNICIENYA
jgi:hypothetical protein